MKKHFYSMAVAVMLCSFMAAGCGSKEDSGTSEGVAAYLSEAEQLWQNYFQAEGDYPIWDELADRGLIQAEEVNLAEEYGEELVFAEDYEETGNFTFTLYIDGNPDNQDPDNLYVLEGGSDYSQIWFGDACRVGGTLFVGARVPGEAPFALDLETKTLTACEKEYETARELFSDWIEEQSEEINLQVWYLNPVACVDGCLIYQGGIMEEMDDGSLEGVIYVAFDESRALQEYLLLVDDT